MKDFLYEIKYLDVLTGEYLTCQELFTCPNINEAQAALTCCLQEFIKQDKIIINVEYITNFSIEKKTSLKAKVVDDI